MNSIESPLLNPPMIPGLAQLAKQESGQHDESQTPQSAALEMLRAMMGDAPSVPTAPVALTAPSECCTPSVAKDAVRLLAAALHDGSLPPELVPLAREIHGRLQNGGGSRSGEADTAVLVQFLVEELNQELPGKVSVVLRGLISAFETRPGSQAQPVDSSSVPTPNAGPAQVTEVSVAALVGVSSAATVADSMPVVGASSTATVADSMPVMTVPMEESQSPKSPWPIVEGRVVPQLGLRENPASPFVGRALPVAEENSTGALAGLALTTQAGGEAGEAVLSSPVGGLPLAIPQGANRQEVLIAALTAFLNTDESVDVPSARAQVPVVDDASTEQAALGNAILQSLNQQSSQAASQQAVTTMPSPIIAERIEQVSSLMTQMADRVLVSDPLHGQTPEVRIKIADDVMPGTEVRVWREPGGQLRVEFETLSAFWARTLNEASPLLAQRLNERFASPEAAQVTVQNHGDQPEDGRSRNRNSPWELAQDQDDA